MALTLVPSPMVPGGGSFARNVFPTKGTGFGLRQRRVLPGLPLRAAATNMTLPVSYRATAPVALRRAVPTTVSLPAAAPAAPQVVSMTPTPTTYDGSGFTFTETVSPDAAGGGDTGADFTWPELTEAAPITDETSAGISPMWLLLGAFVVLYFVFGKSRGD